MTALDWLTVRQVADLLGYDVSTVYAKIRRGVIPAHDFDGRTFVSRRELDRAMRQSPPARGRAA